MVRMSFTFEMLKVSSMVELLLFMVSLQPLGKKYQSSRNSKFYSFRIAYWEGHGTMMFPTLPLSLKSFILGFFFSCSIFSLSVSSSMRHWASLTWARQTSSASSVSKASRCCLLFQVVTCWTCSAVHIWTRLLRTCCSFLALASMASQIGQ
ncbi:hypothetical protein PAXRUDRAFT_764354 [Paxillus rubicundulus Ve08.2h10]|uniref:Secreted protein n=1 Tax=Paxillus rubicundulus Ve08.2h10 TaxID=930991 RepID=A0A0D0CDP1_9AGAM|nr:hypothetical protein PAXRUDRAFT_764354 [Paxillus rubicundulus Ve08.2h10]